MADETSKTPYNSIYETLNPKNQKSDAELVCCKHGCQCAYGRKPVENQYVNLPSPSKEQQVAEKLTAKLEKLKVKEGKIGGSKEKRKKEKRQQPLAEDSHAYEMMGPPTEGSTATSAPITTESLENNVKSDNTSYSAYIGVQSSADAETHVTRRGEFALYHLSEPGACIDNLTPGLPLMLVYYTTTKKHRHYPVRSSGSNGEVHYSVDCGYPIVRKHFSLNQLVQYYRTFGSIQINPDDTCAEAFSWWLE
ncbi:hypothetical protein L5515_014413 [Caenorhabditis briggsae]|uniref:SH2 domain-containing protein n=1 Tax=Caenorhabditis briggsae TaxID=6238 RepID=A0AAE9EC22_CAEBR|nr:hypothetical protein L5515_014413 [Caenorhabditis briggsae]